MAVYEKSLDFNLRDGYDPTTNSALDKVDYSVPYITPEVFNISSTSFATNYKIPQSVAAAYPLVNHTYKIIARTIWNDERILSIGGASVSDQSSTNPNTASTTPSNNVTWVPPTTTPYETSTAITNTPTQTTPPVCAFTTGILVKLPDDGNPATQIDSSVYYYGKDCKRRAFPSSGVYFSWYKDFLPYKLFPQKLWRKCLLVRKFRIDRALRSSNSRRIRKFMRLTRPENLDGSKRKLWRKIYTVLRGIKDRGPIRCFVWLV